jgi:predicted transcriptional regulator
MAVVSVRLNEQEKKVLEYLAEYFHEEKSSLLKRSMFELYEDIQDIRFVDTYLETKGSGKEHFVPADELLD